MSLFNTLNTGVSGLGVNSTGMNVIGDNIANSNTTGFKAQRLAFVDLVQGLSGSNNVGLGAKVSGMSTDFTQGSTSTSTNVSDMSVTGQGFFVLRPPNTTGVRTYSRAGSFYLDSVGNLTNAQGSILQGYNANSSGELSAKFDDIKVDTFVLPPSQTENIIFSANLSSETVSIADPENFTVEGDPIKEEIDVTAFDGSATTYTFSDLEEAAHFPVTTTVYDSQGASHDMTVYFQKMDTNDWKYYMVASDSEIDPAYAYGVEDAAYLVEAGSITFDALGNIESITRDEDNGGTVESGIVTFEGTSDQEIYLDLSEESQLTQTSAPEGSGVTGMNTDGNGTGYLSFLDIDSKGMIEGVYSNGSRLILAQVGIATFSSTSGLSRSGQSMYSETPDSGAPAFGAAGSGGRGTIEAYSLEMSNVNLEKEFVAMIQSQTGYQANARVINSTDQLLQDLIQQIS